jgi:hypothetical protein
LTRRLAVPPGDNKNLFVTAATPLDAVSLWIEYYEIDPEWLPHLSEDTRIALCPVVAASAGVHLWDDIESWNVTADGGVGPFTPRGRD